MIVTFMLGLGGVFAQPPGEPVESPEVNGISLIAKTPNGFRVVEIYAGADNEKTREGYLEWAGLFKKEVLAGSEKFILFTLKPKSLDGSSGFCSELLKHLEISKEEKGIVSGMIPVKNNQLKLNGRIWLLGKKCRIANEADRQNSPGKG